MLNGAFLLFLLSSVCQCMCALGCEHCFKVRVSNGVIFLCRSKEGNFSLWKKRNDGAELDISQWLNLATDPP